MNLRRKKTQTAVLENVEIQSAVAEGNCIARIDNQVVFVKYAAPGDVADIKITGKKKKFLQGKIHHIHTPSALRTEPFCEHFGICGGCKWQHLKYEEQLKFKQQQVVDALERIGGLKGFEVLPILGSRNTRNYRNKLELTFSNKGWVEQFDRENPTPVNALGFHIPGMFDKVLNINRCHLMPEFVNKITAAVRNFCEENKLQFFDIRNQSGDIRNIMLRCNTDGEWMVLIAFSGENKIVRLELLEYLKTQFSQITSLVFVINNKKNDTLHDLDVHTFSGNGFITEKLGNLKFKIRPQSFFQTNTAQAEVLYNATIEMAELTGSELVYDLYTGTGSIALSLAHRAAKVIGIEYVPQAIEDARENMRYNNIDNCEFFSGDMKERLNSEFIQKYGIPNVVITDPPRDGMHPSVVGRLLEMESKKIVYVSCNPSTQARDIAILNEKYSLIKVQPVDMFPHTHHVENVALLELRL